MHSKSLHFFNSIHEVKLVPHFPPLHIRSCIFHPVFSVLHFPVLHFPVPYFPVLHVSTLEIWSFIFQWCRSLFDLSGPSLVPHFPVLHFQLTTERLRSIDALLEVPISIRPSGL